MRVKGLSICVSVCCNQTWLKPLQRRIITSVEDRIVRFRAYNLKLRRLEQVPQYLPHIPYTFSYVQALPRYVQICCLYHKKAHSDGRAADFYIESDPSLSLAALLRFWVACSCMGMASLYHEMTVYLCSSAFDRSRSAPRSS